MFDVCRWLVVASGLLIIGWVVGCWLRGVVSLLGAVCGLLAVVVCRFVFLNVRCVLLDAGACLLFAICWRSFRYCVACCALFVDWCLWFAACRLSVRLSLVVVRVGSCLL